MKLAINQAVLFTAPTDVFMELCSRSGLRDIEFRVPKLKEYLYFHSISEVKKELLELNLNVISMNSIDDFGLVPDENIALLENEAHMVGRMCEAMECSLVISPVGRWFDKVMEMPLVLEKTVERLNMLDRILKPYGAKVGVEPIAFPEFSIQSIHDADAVCKSSSAVDAGLIVDYYNLFQGGMKPDDFHHLDSPVHLIHINDAEFLPEEKLDVCFTRAFPGDGSLGAVDWTVQAIKSGYEGCFSLEIFSKKLWDMSPEAAMHTVVKKLKVFEESVEKGLNEED